MVVLLQIMKLNAICLFVCLERAHTFLGVLSRLRQLSLRSHCQGWVIRRSMVRRSGNYASSQFLSIAWRQTMQPSCLPLANLLPRIMRWRSWVTLPSMFDGQFVGRPCWQGWLQCRSGNDAVLLEIIPRRTASCNRKQSANTSPMSAQR